MIESLRYDGCFGTAAVLDEVFGLARRFWTRQGAMTDITRKQSHSRRGCEWA